MRDEKPLFQTQIEHVSRFQIKLLRALGLALVIGTLSACAAPDTQRFQADPAQPPTAESVRTIYADRTMLTHDLHGTQVEYHGENGISHLWYPGNWRGVPARWKTRVDRLGHDICWQYPSSSRNGLTGISAGGAWQCISDRFYFPSVVQIVEGDPFGLNTGRVPFRMPRGRFLAEELAKQAGIPASDIKVLHSPR